MRRSVPVLVASLALVLAGCPGVERNLDAPTGGDAEAPPPDAPIEAKLPAPVSVTIVSWNVHNFFNDVADSPGLELPEEITPSGEYAAKRDAIAAVLSEIDADVVVLEEVENQATADDLASKLAGYQDVSCDEGNDPRGIDIAVLSKLPIVQITTHTDEFFSPSANPAEVYVFARDAYQIELDVNGRRLIPIGVHLKSGSDDASKLKRLAEAEHLREIVTGIALSDPRAAVIVLGDFNATPDEASVKALLGKPPTEWFSAAAHVPEADRWSFRFSGSVELIDDQIASPPAAELLDEKSVKLLHSSAVDAASDHAPVVATYLVR